MTYNPFLCHGLDPGAQRGSEVDAPYCEVEMGVGHGQG